MNVPMRKFGALVSLLVGASALSAQTQTPTSTSDTSTAGAGEVQRLEKYTVTGSNIPTTLTAAEAGISPVVAIDRLDIDRTGYQNAAELLQKITVANQGAIPISNNATGFTPGATGVSIHGLGPDATLVLINGHRVAPYSVGQSGDTAFVDLNTIPVGMIERVEVLKDGASSVYGADAVAGVVNIILRKNYEGSEALMAYQNTTNKDSSQFTANLVTGVSSDKGSITVGFNYQSRASITNADRIYSAVPPFLSSNSSPINLQISRFAANTALNQTPGASVTGVSDTQNYGTVANPDIGPRNVFYTTPGITPGAAGGNTVSPNGNAVSGSTNNGLTPASQYLYSNGRKSVYNYNQNSWAFPAWTRYGVLMNGERNLFDSDNIKGYFDGSYQTSYTENQLAPTATGDFATPGQTQLVIPANTPNPILTAINPVTHNMVQVTAGSALPAGYQPGPGTTLDKNGLASRVAPTGAYNPLNPFNQDITNGTRFRMAEFGNRVERQTNDAFMATAGIKADNILDRFNADAGFRYSQITYHSDDTYVSANKFNQILNAADPIFSASSSSYIGTSTPYNPFGYYANPIPSNSQVVQYATIRVHDVDVSSIGNGFVTVNTSSLVDLPAGGLGAAAGLDYRVETLNQSPDPEAVSGDVASNSRAAVTRHSRKIGAVFAEVQAPITSPKQHIPGAYSLSVNVSGRYEDFMTAHDHTAVPKVGIRYQPFDDSLTFRASAAKGFLAPSMYKLYTSGIFGLLGLTDSRTGAFLTEVPTQNVGNPRLSPETSKSYNVGVVWSPKWERVKGFTMNIDFWRVDRNGTALVDNQNTIDRFAGVVGGGMLAGERVILDAAGNIAEVVSVYHNAGDTIAKGVDLAGSYALPTERLGRFDFAAEMSYLHSFRQAYAPDQPLQELVDQTTDGQGQDAYLRKKGRAQVDWTFRGIHANIVGNYLDGFHDFDPDGNDRRVGSSWRFDAQLGYTLGNQFGKWLNRTTVTVGGFNLLNRTPPVVQFFGANPNNYPGFIYTSEDRMWYVSLDKKF